MRTLKFIPSSATTLNKMLVPAKATLTATIISTGFKPAITFPIFAMLVTTMTLMFNYFQLMPWVNLQYSSLCHSVFFDMSHEKMSTCTTMMEKSYFSSLPPSLQVKVLIIATLDPLSLSLSLSLSLYIYI